MNTALSAPGHSPGSVARSILTLVTLVAALALIGGTAATMSTSTVNPRTTFSATGPVLSNQVASGAPCRSEGPIVTCSDLFKQRLVPGETYTSLVTLMSNGSVPATSFQLWSAGCRQGPAASPFGGTGDLCRVTWITIHDDAHDVCHYPVRAQGACQFRPGATLSDLAARFGASSPIDLSPDLLSAGIPFTLAIQLDPSVGNQYQGRSAAFTFNWRVSTA